MRSKNEIKREVKFDTNNFTDEVKGWHYDTSYEDEDCKPEETEEEALYVIAQLQKHYKYVDYYTGKKGYYIYASNTINYDENPCDINYKEGQ